LGHNAPPIGLFGYVVDVLVNEGVLPKPTKRCNPKSTVLTVRIILKGGFAEEPPKVTNLNSVFLESLL
jgi:hypothetical protein